MAKGSLEKNYPEDISFVTLTHSLHFRKYRVEFVKDFTRQNNYSDRRICNRLFNDHNFEEVLRKIEKNAVKYPIEKSKGSSKKYNEL